MRSVLLVATACLALGSALGCTTARDRDAKQGQNLSALGEVVLTEATGVAFNRPAIYLAEVEGGQVLFGILDVDAGFAPPTQFQVRIFGQPRIGAALSLMPSCPAEDDKQSIEGACVSTLFAGVTRYTAGTLTIRTLPKKDGDPFDIAFHLANGPESQLVGSIKGVAQAPAGEVHLEPED